MFGQATPEVTITGPATVCPNNFYPGGTIGHNYIATAKLWGQQISCSDWEWIISLDGIGVASGLGNTISNYAFPGIGNYRIQFFTSCGPIRIEKDMYVTSRVKMPNPIRHVTAPLMCTPGQVYTYETNPALDLSDPACYYHYEYYWTAPAGWSINGGGNSYFGHDTSPEIVAPTNTPYGTYTISVESTIPNGQPGPFPGNRFRSTPVNYSLRVGPIDSSLIYVTGTSSVCNGNTYTYTAVVPGGHKTGYSYDWYFPSGWSIQSTIANTITLYVPTYNSSYGPVRFSVNTGCGAATGYSGITTFPCNYTMSGDFMVYPNPSIGELNVEYMSTEGSNDNQNENAKSEEVVDILKKEDFRIELFDKDQKLVKTGNSESGKVTLDTHDLQPGTYFLHIYSGKEVFSQQIIVK